MARIYVDTDIRVNLLPRCIVNMPKVSTRVLTQIMDYTVDVEKQYAPVDTGALRDSIKRILVSSEGGIVRAGGGVRRTDGRPIDYAVYQEYGTSRNAPHPFVRPAAEMAQSAVNQVGNIEAELLS